MRSFIYTASTNAGKLSARYILHIALNDFVTHHHPQVLLHKAVWDILRLATFLRIESISVPIFAMYELNDAGGQTVVSRLTGLPIADVVKFLLRSIACYYSLRPCSVRNIVVTVKEEKGEQETVIKQEIDNMLQDFRKQIKDWSQELIQSNAILSHLISINHLLIDDDDLKDAVETRIQIEQQNMHRIFVGSDDMSQFLGELQDDRSEMLTKRELQNSRTNILPVLDQFNKEIVFKKRLKGEYERRLRALQLQQARDGQDTRPAILTEIEDIETHIDEIKQVISQSELQIQKLQHHRAAAEQDLAQLKSDEELQP